MILHKLHFVLLGGSLLGVGCSAVDPTDITVCTQEARAGITVDVRDSVTNALVGSGSIVVVREGAFVETATGTSGAGPYPLVFERAGTYTVSVTQSGYQPWTKSGVQVTKDKCHVNGVAVTARLQK
jgi:hypothetical protein